MNPLFIHIAMIMIPAVQCLVPIFVVGQEEMLTEIIRHAADNDLDIASTDFAEVLSDLTRHPVNINSASKAEIEAIPLLTPMQGRNLYDYIYTYGEVLSLYELQVIPGFDSSFIRKLAPYILIEPVSRTPRLTLPSLLKRSRHEITVKMEQVFPVPVGYSDTLQSGEINATGYPGSPRHWSFRYSYSWYDKVRIGLAGEKDPGEAFTWNQETKGFDYLAGYLTIEKAGFLRRLIIGNFKALFGQGLTLGTGASLISGPGFTIPGQPAEGFRPTLSMNENNFLRGAAITLANKYVTLHTFISYHPRDARCEESDSSGSKRFVSSLLTTGYHRTNQECLTSNAVKELICGGNISASFSPSQQFGFKTGVTMAYTSYSLPLNAGEEPYRRYNFMGKTNLNAGINFRLLFRGLMLAGEYAMSRNKGMAFLLTGSYQPDARITVRAIYRNYQPMYQALHAQSFGNNSSNANEMGLFIQSSLSFHSRFTVSVYSDICRYPWVKYRVSAPSRAFSWGVDGEWLVTSWCRMNLRIGERRSEINASESGLPVARTTEQRSAGLRYSIEAEPSNLVSIRTRIDTRTNGMFTGDQQWGYLICQDITYKPLNKKISLSARFSLFDIPDYAVRIYVYEPDVRYGFSVPAYQDSGIRTCGVVRLALFRFLDLDLRGGVTWYKGKEQVGNGNDETEGPTRGDITVQILFRM